METYDFLQNTLDLLALINSDAFLQDILKGQEKIAEITENAKNQISYINSESLRVSFLEDFTKKISEPEDRIVASWFHFLVKSNAIDDIKNIFIKKEMYITIIVCTIPIVHHFITEYNEYVNNIENK